MKHLSLLKPDKRTVYLDNGKGQEANYLYIPKDSVGIAGLRKDVAAGAVQYKNLLEFADKRPSQMVLINCSNEEEGLMAVSYLASIYNEKDDVFESDYFVDEDTTAEAQYDVKFEKLDPILSELFDMRPADPDDDDDDDYEMDTWIESPCRLPIIDLAQIKNYDSNSYSVFQEDDMFSVGGQRNRRREPYWLSASEEPVCIVVPNDRFGLFGNWQSFGDASILIKNLKRFTKNRHVYVLIVDNSKAVDSSFYSLSVEGVEEYASRNQTVLCEVVLEYTAETVDIGCKEDDKKKYYQVLFENWAAAFGCKLEKRFPKNAIVEQIVSMKSENKSELIEKIYKYVLKTDAEKKILTKEDFSVLKKFRVLGAGANKQVEKRSLESLEKNLVGMQNVKKQVYDIVDRMKYNKLRTSMGLMKGGYHNVHLLIGAPGTAKTTIAQMMGEIMYEQRLLPSNRFVSINGADLKGLYVGHSAPKTHQYFEEYDVILIDEAYSLASSSASEGGEPDSFSQEAISQLIIEIEKHGTDKLVMFAGYGGMHVAEKDNKMKQFLKANPGIRSRINSTIYFDSYTPQEMVEIVHRHAENQEYILTHEADDMIREYFAARVNEKDFGNGREARSLLENITKFAASRTMKLSESQITKKALQQLCLEDVKAAIEQQRSAYLNQQGRVRERMGFV